MSNLLMGKRAFITGANRGIGKVIAETFASNGANLTLCARKETKEFILFSKELTRKYDVSIALIYFDLSNEVEIKEVLNKYLLKNKGIDILINNAGIAHGGFFNMTSIHKIKEVFEVNFFSQLIVTQLISRVMIRNKKGSIINISSVAGIDALPGYIAYGSSKSALIFATRSISKELASYGIRVNALAPGLTDTEMAKEMEFKAKDHLISASSMARMATPQEIADSALFLASDLSHFINGQILRVDGGM